MTPSQQQYHDALATVLASPILRVFLWRLIVEDCRVFQEDFPTNASAYCLLAKQEIGKRLLADAKAVNPDAVFQAERDYQDMQKLNSEFNQGNQEGD